jgi:co-chaperonin GroES (HSP10)
MKTVSTDNIKNPFQPLFFQKGRVLVKVVEFNLTTKAGIQMDQLDPKLRLKDAQVMSISPDMLEEAEKAGLKVGDYVVIPDISGLVFTPARHTMAKPETPLVVFHAMDIYIKWKCYPQDYYTAVCSDFDEQNNDLDTFVK